MNYFSLKEIYLEIIFSIMDLLCLVDYFKIIFGPILVANLYKHDVVESSVM